RHSHLRAHTRLARDALYLHAAREYLRHLKLEQPPQESPVGPGYYQLWAFGIALHLHQQHAHTVAWAIPLRLDLVVRRHDGFGAGAASLGYGHLGGVVLDFVNNPAKLEYASVTRLQIKLDCNVLVSARDAAIGRDESVFEAAKNGLARNIPLGGYLVYGCI